MRQTPRPPERKKDEVLFGNETTFREKLERIRAGGLGHLHIVADFDRTLTKGRSDLGSHENTSPGLLAVPGFVHEEITSGKHALFERYRPIELDPDMSEADKEAHMQTWLRESERLYVDHHLSIEQIQRMARSGLVTPRQRFKELFDFTREHNLPFLIFSAGIGDFITEYLEFHETHHANVHVVANFFRFDDSGCVMGWKGDVFTSANKNESHASFDVRAHDIRRRQNVLLLGDNAGDARMAQGEKHANILSVGFLNGEQRNLKQHLELFDAVIPNDVGLDFPLALLEEVGKNKTSRATVS
jgi:HAD superfamily hydrolase (TIGR01544 family)